MDFNSLRVEGFWGLRVKKLKSFCEFIKIEHTVFALPFAYFGAIVGSRGLPLFREFFWITIAMFGARSFAMCLNRIVDRNIDSKNPRTKIRHLITGEVTLNEAVLFCVFALFVFILSAYMLNRLAHILWPIFLLPIIFYSFSKRWTWLCHFILGLSLGLAPVGAFIAVTNRAPDIGIWLISVGILLWTSGFDIIYAIQDYEFDKNEGLYSIPANFGIHNSYTIVALLHLGTVIVFLLAGWLLHLNYFYYLGIGFTAGLLFYENFVADDINTAFFKVNGLVSFTILFFTMLDILILKY